MSTSQRNDRVPDDKPGHISPRVVTANTPTPSVVSDAKTATVSHPAVRRMRPIFIASPLDSLL